MGTVHAIDLLKLGLTAAVLGFPNLGPSVFFLFFTGPFATKFCTHSATDSMNKCCKFGYCLISTCSCVHILWLNRMYWR